MIKTLLPILFLASGLSAPVAAEPVQQAVRVSYADLNLQSAAGVQILDSRIAKAVDSVCVSDNTDKLARVIEMRSCRDAKTAEVAVQRAEVLAKARSTGQAVASLR